MLTHEPFIATVVGNTDITETTVIAAVSINNPVMAVLTPIMEVHITKEQAMAFFNLIPAQPY